MNFKASNINRMWKRKVENMLMQRRSEFQDFYTTSLNFIRKKFW